MIFQKMSTTENKFNMYQWRRLSDFERTFQTSRFMYLTFSLDSNLYYLIYNMINGIDCPANFVRLQVIWRFVSILFHNLLTTHNLGRDVRNLFSIIANLILQYCFPLSCTSTPLIHKQITLDACSSVTLVVLQAVLPTETFSLFGVQFKF